MKYILYTITLFFNLLFVVAHGKAPVKIACVGNSITYGARVPDREKNAYPSQLQAMLGDSYQVMNFGVNGATMLRKGNKPYWETPEYKNALESRPDLVFIKLGTNDSKLVNRVHLSEFEKDYHDLVQSFAQLPSHPRIVLLLPVPAFTTDTISIWNEVILKQIIPRIRHVAYQDQLEVLDLYSLFIDQPDLLSDKIHPTAEGAAIIAKRIYESIVQEKDLKYNIIPAIKIPTEANAFYGYECHDFTFRGRTSKIVKPKWSAKGHPWVWRARFFGHEPQADIALLERGFHLVYCDVAELFGNDEAISIWNDFYNLLRKAGLAPKAVMEGMSRGGVYVYNWAAVNPTKVACVYADNPVLDLKSWPGGKGKGPGSEPVWETFKKNYGLASDEEAIKFTGSPIDKVKAIVKGGYPMLHVCGDADEVVPVEENTMPFAEKVKALNGDIKVIYKPGGKHHPHSLPNPTPIVNFILAATGYQVKEPVPERL